MNPIRIFFILVSILAGCASHNAVDQEDTVEKIADEVIGGDCSVTLNVSGTFALCQQKPGADHARRQYRFIVIHLKDKAVVHEGTFRMGYVAWHDDHSIEVVSESWKEGSTKKIIPVTSPME